MYCCDIGTNIVHYDSSRWSKQNVSVTSLQMMVRLNVGTLFYVPEEEEMDMDNAPVEGTTSL